MPVDLYEDDDKEPGFAGVKSKFTEFECPTCTVINPCDPPAGNGDEVLCLYCGGYFEAKVTDEGRLKLRES